MESRIIAVNGKMTLPIGWSLPITQDEDISVYQGFHDEGLIHLFPSPIIFQVNQKETKIPFCKQLFYDLVYIFYFNAFHFHKLGIDLESVMDDVLYDILKIDSGTELNTYVTDRHLLIQALKNICDLFDKMILEIMAKNLGDPRLPPLVASYHHLAYNDSVARRAIAMRVLHRSSNLSWLSAANKRWGFEDTIDEWMDYALKIY